MSRGRQRLVDRLGTNLRLLLDSRVLAARTSRIVTDRLWVCDSLAALRSGALRSGLSDTVNAGYALWYTICVP